MTKTRKQRDKEALEHIVENVMKGQSLGLDLNLSLED